LRIAAEQESTNEQCEDRAAWNYAIRLSRSRGLQYTVFGHSQNKKIYTPGELISVEDIKRNINEKYLIKKVSFKQNETEGQTGGNTTIIDLVPRGSYRISASEPEAAKKEEMFSLE
jgi:prophage tail gpP-like protein